MTTKSKTKVTAEAGRQELFISREFDAPRELVFKAFSTPELMVRFLAPAGAIMKFNYSDFKNGGSYSWTQGDAEGNVFCTFKGSFHELLSPERIVQTTEMEGLPEGGHVILEVYTFEDLGGGRTRLTIQDVCRSVADRDALVESGMEHGLVAAFDQLDVLISQNNM